VRLSRDFSGKYQTIGLAHLDSLVCMNPVTSVFGGHVCRKKSPVCVSEFLKATFAEPNLWSGTSDKS
jgi:hypothetical protein